jgi:ferredoxin--NADP+ reductase
MSNLRKETVKSVRRWTEGLFSFTTTRDPGFRFDAGMFTMIGLEVNGRPLLRAYSVASPSYAEELEFLSIVVPEGPLTSKLQHIKPGDEILVGAKPTGTLLLHNLTPGRTLYLMATGTGLAAFLGLIREPEVYERFDKVVLVHGVRHVAELAYRDYLTNELPKDDLLGELVSEKLIYVPTVTREDFVRKGRVTELLENGSLAKEFNLPELNPQHDRIMICGSTAMLNDLADMLDAKGFQEGSNAKPGDYVVEKAFADQNRSKQKQAAE